MTLLLQLVLAHLLGDFLLQPSVWVTAKERRKIQAWQLYLHGFIHGLLIMIITRQANYWPLALLLASTHLLIDGIKLSIQNERNKRMLFFWDQAAHFLSILLIWNFFYGIPWHLPAGQQQQLLVLIIGIITLTMPTSIAVKTFISRWQPQLPIPEDHINPLALERAGKYIGYMERLLTFLFLLTGHWAAIGFLITAKSIFRFGDLTKGKERQLTEYVLIGTLLSFGIAIFVGLACQYLLKYPIK